MNNLDNGAKIQLIKICKIHNNWSYADLIWTHWGYPMPWKDLSIFLKHLSCFQSGPLSTPDDRDESSSPLPHPMGGASCKGLQKLLIFLWGQHLSSVSWKWQRVHPWYFYNLENPLNSNEEFKAWCVDQGTVHSVSLHCLWKFASLN